MGRFKEGIFATASKPTISPGDNWWFLDDDSVLWGSDMNDHLLAAPNTDSSIRGWMGDDLIIGFNGDDRLHGCVGNDTLIGGAGDDLLVGCFGQDVLQGGSGDDTLFGDRNVPGTQIAILDADVLSGGGGSDTFVLATSFRPNPAFMQNMLTQQVWDTVTDLDLDTDKIALRFEVNGIFEEAASSAATLEEAVAELFGTSGILSGTTNKAMILNHAGEEWLIATGATAGSEFGKDDLIAKITGFEGQLSLDDFVLTNFPAYVIGNEIQFLDHFYPL